MSKKFFAVHRETGEKWRPSEKGQYLIMYDTGLLGVVSPYSPGLNSIIPLDNTVWRTKVKETILPKKEINL